MRTLLQDFRRMTPRQRAAGLAVGAISLAVVITGAGGRPGWAAALLGLLGVVMFGGLLQLRRRLVGTEAAIRHDLRTIEQRMTGPSPQVASHDSEGTRRLDAAHRRVLAAVESERLAAADRQQELLTRIDRAARSVAMVQRNQAQDVEALLQLYLNFHPRAPMPPSGRWALNAAGLLELLHLVERHRPKLVLELGSGTSTVWLGYALEQYGGRLVSMDHAPEFAERTRSMLALHSLERTAEVRLAPLQPFHLDGRDFQWYDADQFADLGEVSLLLVDGPPGVTGQGARYPALPVLASRLAAGAIVVLDDAQRPDEQELMKQWLAEFSDLSAQPAIFDRQAVLTYTPGLPA